MSKTLSRTLNRQSEGMELLTVEDVCRLLRLAAPTLYHWRYIGRGPRWLKVGGRLRYRLSDIETWLESQERKTADDD